ncbi:hypothetical protein [Streptococcus sp.]|uniref:hypothetical protein n=1 Tax=Streptococcus sp. TaxID=1306 RepID=UPI00391DB4F9
MQFLKIVKALPLILIAGAVILLTVYICLDNGAWAYLAARLLGLEEKYASNMEWLVIAVQSLIFTSDWFMVGLGPFLTGVWKNHLALITKSISVTRLRLSA